jgi:hypothetical protein
MEKVNLMPKRANLQGDGIITCIQSFSGSVQLQTCGHPKAHQKKSDPLTTSKADLQTSPNQTTLKLPTSIPAVA